MTRSEHAAALIKLFRGTEVPAEYAVAPEEWLQLRDAVYPNGEIPWCADIDKANFLMMGIPVVMKCAS